jgi:hypothetical protein
MSTLLPNHPMIHPTSESIYIERRPLELARDQRRLSGPAYDDQIPAEAPYKRQFYFDTINDSELAIEYNLGLNQCLTV